MKRSLSESTLSLAIINDLEDIKKSENNIVLFGSVGNGKTLLLNKACGANYLKRIMDIPAQEMFNLTIL